jgi:subtilase family serine protease
MTGRFKSVLYLFAAFAFVLIFNVASQAQYKRALVTQDIDETQLTTLVGNTRPEAIAENDRGAVSPDFQLDHMLLLLKRAPELESEFEQFIEDQHNPKSANFHKWLSAAEIGERYGLAESDLDAITGWLYAKGFQVNVVYANNMFIDFSGTAGQVENAFHTPIHNYNVDGVDHIANASDPKIPTALAPAMVGVVSLNDFPPRAMHEQIKAAHIDPKSGREVPDYTNGGGYETLVPYDLEVIYNIKPLLTSGISGQGMKIVVLEDTNQWNCNATNSLGACSSTTSDWAIFRNTFGLSRYTAGNLSQENPKPQTGSNNCTIPTTGSGYPSGSGINSDDVEASIDVQWASAAAPSASIINAACRDTTVFGGTIALLNILSHPNADNVDVVSMSYGESEESSGATLNASFNTAFQQAVAQGVAIFVSSGDEDAASSGARDGITISGWMSSQYDVSVGGLDFADTYLGVAGNYWNATNNVFYGSAKSYIMEQPWNDSCAGTLLANYETGSYITYGAGSFCQTNSSFRNATGGSGGPSACATGAPSVSGVASGTCAGYPKPSFQSSYIGSMAGLVNDGVRDTPDVSLMAANGLWGHYYLICYTDTTSSGLSNGGIPSCTATQPVNWPGYGGTSVSSPIMAAIQSLVVQHKGSLQGNPNPRYYALAATEYGPSGNAGCDSTLGNGVAGSCIFYDITLGDNDGYCVANRNGNYYDCYHPGTTSGVISTSNTAYQPAYPTGPDQPFPSNGPGWDFATGIGSVNAYNLVMGY